MNSEKSNKNEKINMAIAEFHKAFEHLVTKVMDETNDFNGAVLTVNVVLGDMACGFNKAAVEATKRADAKKED